MSRGIILPVLIGIIFLGLIGLSQDAVADIVNTVDTTGTVGFYTSITIGADSFPVISYYDSTNADLKVVYVQFEGTSEPEDKNNPCDALDKASDKGNGKKKGLDQAKSNNNC